MDQHDGKIVLNGAPSQYDRWLPALDSGYAKPDDRSFSELLNFATRFGTLIHFYNLEDRIDGDWAPFFLSDPTMVLAAILATNPAVSERTFADLKDAILKAGSFDRKFALLRSMFEFIAGLARQINSWLSAIAPDTSSETARLLQAQIVALIESSLSAQLRFLKAYSEGAALPDALGQPIDVDFRGFLPIWNLKGVCPDGSIYKGKTRTRKIDHSVPSIELIFWAFMDAFSQLEQFAATHFAGTLTESNHKPFLGLYMAFLKLFETAQHTLNTMSVRYWNFYYRDFLRETNQPPIPDSVYLAFVLDDAVGLPGATVPKDTLFPAGQDPEGADILYAADEEAFVTAAAIAILQNVRVVTGPLLISAASPLSPQQQPEGSPPGEWPHRILTSKINLAALNSQTVPPPTWPTFGSGVAEKTGVVETAPSTLGFAVASSYLMLTGGDRTITVWFEYSCNCLSQIEEATGLDGAEILETLLTGDQCSVPSEQTFELFISTAVGWLPVVSYSVQAQADPSPPAPSEFSLIFQLPSTVAPVVPITPETPPDEKAGVSTDAVVNATNPSPDLPTLKAYLRQDGPILLSGSKGSFLVYPISVLSALRIHKIRIATQTRGLADLNLQTTDGAVDATAPFPVFGAAPMPGTFLQLSNPELFVKIPQKNSLKISIQWSNLPANETGFRGYYQDYVIGLDGQRQPDLFDNQTFRGAFQVINAGHWQVENVWPNWIDNPPADPDVFLFRTQAVEVSPLIEPLCDYPIPAKARPLCETTGFDTLEVHDTGSLPAYYDPATSAIRLYLTAPRYGFGNDLYTKNVLHSVLQQLPVPNGTSTAGCPICQPLWDASQGIGACLAACADAPSEEFVECVLPCLQQWQERLLLAFQGAYLQCLAQCPDLPVEDTISAVEEIFCSCTAQSPPMTPAERAHCIYNRLVASPPWLAGCAQLCLDKCLVLLEAVFWIEECNGICTTDVDLSSAFNISYGIVTTGATFSGGGLDGTGNSYCSILLDLPVMYKGSEFKLGSANALDAVTNAILSLPSGHFVELQIAAAMVYKMDDDSPQTFTVTYSDAPPDSFTQEVHDWTAFTGGIGNPCNESVQTYPGETVVAQPRCWANDTGTTEENCVSLYAYSFPMDGTKTAVSLTLPPQKGRGRVVVLAMNLVGDPKECMIEQVTACSLKLQDAYNVCVKAQPDIRYPNPPWLPTAQTVSLDYAAQCVFSPAISAEECGRFFHLLPFDGYKPASASCTATPPLLPEFPFAGSLYIGFSNLVQRQTLPLLFQMASGSSPDLPAPAWQYLEENSWIDLRPSQIRLDTTNGLQNSGILTLALPQLDSAETTLLPAENQWLRVIVPSSAQLFPETANIYPHVLLASWQNNGGAGENLRQPVPPFTINSSVQALPGIAAITQPMASFAGRPRQNDREFVVSLGERLRHKDRAILSWDYERLVLDRFPAIWKVQALPARNLAGGNAPGDVLVVVVAGEDSLEVADPTVPLASSEMLRQIHDYLRVRSSPFVSLQVVNPVYVRITVQAAVLFHADDSVGDDIEQLNSDLVKYLSPWYYNAARAAKGGDYASPDSISEFIQNQPYVDALIQLELKYHPDPEDLPWYFLTSADKHDIKDSNTLAMV